LKWLKTILEPTFKTVKN